MVVASDPILPTEFRSGPDWPYDERAEMLTLARQSFLSTRRVPAGIRPEIAGSWRRSILCGVSPVEAEPQYHPSVNLDSQLVRVAVPVLDRREAALERIGCGIIITDADVRVLRRWGSSNDLERDLTERNLLPGYCFGEAVVGTNGAALALETGEPAEVHGAEHFLEDLVDFTCAAIPMVHPVSRRLLGSLNVFCRCADASPLLMPWLLEVSQEIKRRLRTESCIHEQLLLEAYVGAKRDCRHPIVCLNDHTILSNSAAARLMGTVDQGILWEQASRAIHERDNEVSTLVLSDGRRVSALCHPIFDGLSAIGAKIEIRLDLDRERTTAKRRQAAGGRICLGDLSGRSLRWQQLCHEVQAAKASGSRTLLVGEPGTGKLSILRAMFAGEQIEVFDAGLCAIDGPNEWLQRLNARLQDDSAVVVLQHLEALELSVARTVASLVERSVATIGGTLTSSDGVAPAHGTPLEPFRVTIPVPALRDRLDDLRDLLHSLTARHSREGAAWHWMPDAVQTLSRVEWPGNVRSLESTIRQVVAGRVPGYVDALSLPPSVRAAGSRRRLSRLEQLEAAAITDALQQSQGNKLEAAQSLGIARSTLYRRMRSLGLDLTAANY